MKNLHSFSIRWPRSGQTVHRITIAILKIALLTLGAVVVALAAEWGPPLPGEVITVDDGDGNQFDPHNSGPLVAYTSQLGTRSEIRYRNIDTGAGGTIPGPGQDLLPDVFGDTIVFTRFIPGGAAIYAFSVSSGNLDELDAQPESRRRNPAIGVQTVVWEDFGFWPDNSGSDLVVYDLDTQTTTRLTHDVTYDLQPAISPDGSVIVWLKCQSSARVGCDVWQALRVGSDWVLTQLTGNETEESSVATDGQTVVYASTRAGETDIYWRSINSGAEQQLALPGIQRNPSISDDLILFESQDMTHNTYDVVLYDVVSDTLYQVTETPTISETLNDISVTATGQVYTVWAVGVSGDLNVYGRSFPHPRSETPQQAIGGIIEDVATLVDNDALNQGQGNALTVKLEKALWELEQGNTAGAIEALQDFINTVEAYIKAGALSEAEGRPLIDAAAAVISQLGG
jgi:hypothetical protein